MNYPLALKNGTILAQDYRIEEILGAGGSGITYRAKEISLDRDIAIKEYFPGDFAMREGESQVCPKTEADEEDYTWGLDRFIDEAQTLAKFDHSNIVRVFRYFQTHNTAYMVLKFEEGQHFKSWLENLDQPPSQAELDVIITPLLDALELIHKDNFLHRDIAPDNIIIRRNGSPVLIDFGSARRVITSRPKTVSALIKPGYSPFEQYAMTGKDQGPWTDIYSLAATLYHAVVGKRPVDSPTRMVGDELIPAEKAAAPGYRIGFLKAIDQALKLKTRERPQTIAEWREQLFATTHSPVKPKAKKASKSKKAAKPTQKETTAKQPEESSLSEPDQLLADLLQGTPAAKKPAANKSIAHKAQRHMKRAFIRFLAEYARPEKNEDLQKAGSLISRLGEMRDKTKSEKSLEDQLSDMRAEGQKQQSKTLRIVENTRKRKNNFIKKILSTPHDEEEEKPKPKPAPNKSFEPQITTQHIKDEEIKVTEKQQQQEQNLVTVRLNRKKINVEPGPTTLARAKIRDKHQEKDTPHTDDEISKFSIALRTMQIIMLFAIVLPIVYFFSINQGTIETGSLSNSQSGLLATMRGHNNKVTSLAFTENGTQLISGGYDNNIRIWDFKSRKLIKTLKAHRADINALDISGSTIISADKRGEIILWDMKKGKALKNFQAHKSEISSVVFTGNEQNFFTGSSSNKVKFWNANNTRQEIYKFRAHTGSIRQIAYSDRHRLIATASSDNEIKLWNLNKGEVIRRYSGHKNGVNTIAFSPSGQRFASGGYNEIKIWSTRSRRQYRNIRAHSGKVTAVSFSPNGKWMASAGEDRLIKIWNWQRGELVKTLQGHGATVNALAFTPDSKFLASGGNDYSIKLWTVPSS